MQNNLVELIQATKDSLGLSEFVIEKDYYLSKVLRHLSSVENDNFQLVFSGGTCLAKAHRVVNRMSEDIDFKFQKKEAVHTTSKTKYLKALKNFREQLIALLKNTIFSVEEIKIRNEGKYLCITLKYPCIFPPNTALRPHLLLEFSDSKIRLPTKNLPVITLIENTLGTMSDLVPCTLKCISIEETAAEKWVGLTRRIAAIDRGYYVNDITLVRHLYDLSAIYKANQLGESFSQIIGDIISNDAKQFKNQHPEYNNNPMQEIQRSLSLLKTDPIWKTHYQNFIDAMVYDQVPTHPYDDTIQLVERIGRKILALPENKS